MAQDVEFVLFSFTVFGLGWAVFESVKLLNWFGFILYFD
jgi:hypothetical protein